MYTEFFQTLDEEWQQVMSIRTYYEQKFAEQGSTIKYIRFRP